MRRGWETADTVIAVSTALLVAVFAIFGALVWRGYGQTLATAERNVAAGAEAVAARARWFTDAAARAPGAEPGAPEAALLALPPDLLHELVRPPVTLAEATGLLAREDGTVIAAYAAPDPENPAPAAAIAPPPPGEHGAFDLAVGPGGMAAIAGFHRIPELSLVAMVTLPREAVLGPLWQATLIVTALMAPFAIGMFLGSLWLARLLRRSERQRRDLAAALDQNQLLFREIHHRVKNNLQSIASLLQLQPIPAEVKAEMGQRIAAMSAVHEHIYRSDDFRRVRIKEYVHTLVAGIGAGHDPKVRLTDEVDDVLVDRDAATPLGLIINEVIANSYKHAFPDGSGTISISLRRDGEGRGVLTIADDGVGYDVARPSRGIGRRLVEALTAQIGGRSSFESGTPGGRAGTRFTLTFPLAA